MNQSNTALAVTSLSYSLGKKQLLRDISVTLEKAKVYVLLGPNGAGKSTFLSQIFSNHKSDVLFYGQHKSKWERQEFARNIAFLPQQSGLTFSFTALEVVEMGATPLTLSNAEVAQRVKWAMELLDVSHLSHQPYPILSGGEKQRIHVARILTQLAQSTEPLIVLDEPTSALDLAHQHKLLSLLREKTQDGATVLLVLHDLNLASQYADELLFLKDGELVLQGTPWDTFSNSLVGEIYGYPIDVLPHPKGEHPLIVS